MEQTEVRRGPGRPPKAESDKVENQRKLPSNPELKHFLSSIGAKDSEFEINLYRKKNDDKGKPVEAFIDTFTEIVPNLKEIKSMYGGGTYIIRVSFEDQNKTFKQEEREVYIDGGPSLVEVGSPGLVRNAFGESNTPTRNTDGQDPFFKMLAMMKAVLDVVKPQEKKQDTINEFISLNQLASQMMQSTFETQLEMQRRFFKSMPTLTQQGTTTENQEGEQEEQSRTELIINRVLSVVEQFAGAFKSMPDSARKPIIEKAKQSQDFKHIVATQARRRLMLAKMAQRIGDENAVEVAKMFGWIPDNTSGSKNNNDSLNPGVASPGEA